MSHPHHLKPKGAQLKFNVSPESVGWNYLGYQVVKLKDWRVLYIMILRSNEAALVPLHGEALLECRC